MCADGKGAQWSRSGRQERPYAPLVLDLAAEENLIVTTPDGRQFVVAEIDDF